MTTNASKTLKFANLGTVAATLLSGCNTDSADDGSGNGPSDAASSASASPGGQGPAYTAISTVEQEGGQVVGIDRVDEGEEGYHVEVLDGDMIYEVDVDTTGKNPQPRTKTDFEAPDLKRIQQVTVPLADALKTAQEAVPHKNVDEATLEGEGDMVTWEIELDVDHGQGGSDVQVDARSGEVVK
ncbi:PepSY domain-containing protein [Arthrobacter sp. JSM 101049]|uniref:PepSY domain-containing protein n=1 Tax=Arthrobacter sp. JSM 101049 TaxID=929097 RepID=UPI003569CB83